MPGLSIRMGKVVVDLEVEKVAGSKASRGETLTKSCGKGGRLALGTEGRIVSASVLDTELVSVVRAAFCLAIKGYTLDRDAKLGHKGRSRRWELPVGDAASGWHGGAVGGEEAGQFLSLIKRL